MGWQQKLQDSTYQRVARNAGVRNLDSANDVRLIEQYLSNNPQLTQSKYIDNARAAGVTSLDSQNDIRRIDNYLANQSPTQQTQPTSSPASTPAPSPQPSAPAPDYSGVMQGYKDQIASLTSQYNSALANNATAATNSAAALAKSQGEVRDMTDKYNTSQQQNESLKQENQRYLDASANAELAKLRSGATTSGGNSSIGSSSAMRGAGLSGGGVQYQSSADGGIEKTISVENSVLSNKGPVVSQLSTALSRQKGATSTPNRGLASGSAQSYYSSRFG